MRRVSIVSAWRIEDNPRAGCRLPKSPTPIRDETTENKKRPTGCSGALCDLRNGVTCQHQALGASAAGAAGGFFLRCGKLGFGILSLSSGDMAARSVLSSLPSLLVSYFASISVWTVCCSGVNAFLAFLGAAS